MSKAWRLPGILLTPLLLALLALAILWPLGLTNRVLAGVDAYTYFLPYWDYRIGELQAGRLPLWNPYLFLGVPFLANPQSAVLYPLHLLVAGMQASSALVWSAILHVWLAALFAYVFCRRSLACSRSAATLGGALFGFGGFTLARVENINQLNGLAWLPALMWLLDEAQRSADRRMRVRWSVALAVVVALQLLAGHTQTTFINLVGLLLFALCRLAGVRARGWAAVPAALAPVAAVVPGVLLSAAQLLPTLELNPLGLRSGGLPYRQAVSFSLRPRLLLQSLLPPAGGGLGEAFGNEGYAEFSAYLGVGALVLALLGAVEVWRRWRAGRLEPAHIALLLLAGAGLFLALGVVNPVYYLLWRFVPGFDLFRAPARWMALYTLGAAGLAAIGLDALGPRFSAITLPRRWLLPLVLIVAALLAVQILPQPMVLLAWATAAGITALLLALATRRLAVARVGLLLLAGAELALGSRALPFTLAADPGLVNGIRPAPAALLVAASAQPEAGRDRFLSMSDIRFDPGDLAELRSLQAGILPAESIERGVRAAKQTELLAPNLPLRWRMPAVDGYDGGTLPLRRYVALQSLFLPPGEESPDGRLREQLHAVPPDSLLDLTGVRWLITDKQNDLWAGDVYYDLEQTVRLQPGDTIALSLPVPSFSATGAGVVSYLEQELETGAIAAELRLEGRNGSRTLELRAGKDTALPGETVPGGPPVARAWPGDGPAQGHDYLARLDFATPLAVEHAVVVARTPVVLRGLSLVDSRTGAHVSVTLSRGGDVRRIHSGDVKLYERTSGPGRAWLVHRAAFAPTDAAALVQLGEGGSDPRYEAVLDQAAAGIPGVAALASVPAESSPGDELVTVDYRGESAAWRVRSAHAALLVVSDAYYPGWEAEVDGSAAPLLRANLMFRAVPVPAGEHEITMRYAPASWRAGVIVSAATALLLLAALAATFWPRPRTFAVP